MGSFLSSELPTSSSAAPAATAVADANPHWMLAPYGGGTTEGCNITGDSKTIAVADISRGHRIIVSLRHEPLSALSHICLCFLPGTAIRPWACSTVIAAHGGSVLLKITWREGNSSCSYSNYFVYNVGAAATDPPRWPSLYRFPGPYRGEKCRPLDISATGLLCRGEDEFVVAELTVVGSEKDAAAAARCIAFEFRLFRHGKWSVKRPLIVRGDHCSIDEKQLWLWAQWETIAVVPLNNGMLCWVDRYTGVIFSDVFDEGPNKLRYVPYPAKSVVHRRERFVCTNVHGALKLVSMAPNRCSHCGCCKHDSAFDIWTLQTDDMSWVLETETNKVVDSTELWMLPNTPGYARVHLVYLVESMNRGGHIVASMSGSGDNDSDESDDVSDESSAMEEEDEHTSLSFTASATASLHDGLQGKRRDLSFH